MTLSELKELRQRCLGRELPNFTPYKTMAAAATSHAGGTLADTAYQRTVCSVLAIANTLRELGVDNELQVPALVIAGDQSSGKSSVVEAITGISLPRADGTCTRCPTEIRMRTQDPMAAGPSGSVGDSDDETLNNAAGLPSGSSSSTSWQCRIKLCCEFDSEDKPLAEKPPEQLFCVVTDKAHVTACVSAAQAVLLNPRAVEATVVLEIDGAEADLTIIDLPGIIHSHADPDLIKLVKHMIKASLAPAHHIIVMALPAGQDAENQAIRLWAREVDPDGHRSIGIITKPDRVPESETGENQKLIKLVEASAGSGAADGHLRLGYYVVKNPGQEQLAAGISSEERRESEARYFAIHLHWSRAARRTPALLQRLGADALRTGLSGLLVEQITAQLPEMRRSCRELLGAVQGELHAMPRPVQDAPRELDRLLARVAAALHSHIHADADCAFYQRTKAMYRAYGEGVMRSLPAFLVGSTLISALDSSDKGMDVAAVAAGNSGDLDLGALAAQAAQGAAAITMEAEAEAFIESDAVQKLLAVKIFLRREHMTLRELKELRQRCLGRELPNFTPYKAMESLLQRFKGKWHEPAMSCLSGVAAAAHKLADEVVATEFGRYPAGSRTASAALSRRVEGLVDGAAALIEQLLRMEDGDVFTRNEQRLRELEVGFLARLKRAYLRPQALEDDDAFLAQPTPVDDELHMAASCLAYFKVAFGRVQDMVPMAIRGTLLDRLGSQDEVVAAMQREVPDMAAAAPRLLSEDPRLAARRLQCEQRERRLRDALDALYRPAAA
ncbi:hypothetical protein HXX76_014642 [Chlamydomonas incerta]|uniref:GED domain-containing protein n=1 Tax=Chlamydomonas incerta TaxID=51695 RepID=A0A835SEV7_CHLIN|nr:hypothetical protein HXX76_014642 [Chlamydomonas incerta]|eukprot:KAG2424261.1 hypothetical protein HXX76_014642 [Chlamydomonas incerta]